MWTENEKHEHCKANGAPNNHESNKYPYTVMDFGSVGVKWPGLRGKHVEKSYDFGTSENRNRLIEGCLGVDGHDDGATEHSLAICQVWGEHEGEPGGRTTRHECTEDGVHEQATTPPATRRPTGGRYVSTSKTESKVGISIFFDF